MQPQKPLILPASTEEEPVSVVDVRRSFSDLRRSGPMDRLLRMGLPLSELADPEVQRLMVDATMLDVMMHAEKEDRFGTQVDYNARRSAAVQFAKMKGFDSGGEKRRKVLEEIDTVKRFLAADVVKKQEEP